MAAAFWKECRLILRDRWLVALSMLVPILVISIIAAALLAVGGGPGLTIAVVDEDGGPVAKAFTAALAEHADVLPVSRAEAERFVGERHLGPLAVVFPEGLSDNYGAGTPSDLELWTDPAQEDGIRTAKTLLLLMEKQARADADPFAEELIAIEERNLTGTRKTVTAFEQNVPGFALMFVLIAVVFGTALGLHHERDWATLPRLLIAPAGVHRALAGGLAARFALGTLQMLVLLVWSHLAFGVSLGSSPLALVVLMAAVVLATVATGLLVAAVTRSRAQAQPLGLAVAVVLSGLGGLWWPPSMTPDWMQAISPFAYTTWAMDALNDLVLRDRGLDATVEPVGALALYAGVVFVVGLWLFGRRHRPA
jgi:ABC-2 type transport system permease protein